MSLSQPLKTVLINISKELKVLLMLWPLFPLFVAFGSVPSIRHKDHISADLTSLSDITHLVPHFMKGPSLHSLGLSFSPGSNLLQDTTRHKWRCRVLYDPLTWFLWCIESLSFSKIVSNIFFKIIRVTKLLGLRLFNIAFFYYRRSIFLKLYTHKTTVGLLVSDF